MNLKMILCFSITCSVVWAGEPKTYSDTARSDRYVDVGVFGARRYVDMAKLDGLQAEEPFALETVGEIPSDVEKPQMDRKISLVNIRFASLPQRPEPKAPPRVEVIPLPSGQIKSPYHWKDGLCGFTLQTTYRATVGNQLGTRIRRELFVPSVLLPGQKRKDGSVAKYTDFCGWIEGKSLEFAMDAYRKQKADDTPCLTIDFVTETTTRDWKTRTRRVSYGLNRQMVGRKCTSSSGGKFQLRYNGQTLELAIEDLSPGGKIWYVEPEAAPNYMTAVESCRSYRGKTLPTPDDFSIAVSHGLLEAFGFSDPSSGFDSNRDSNSGDGENPRNRGYWTSIATRGFRNRGLFDVTYENRPLLARCIGLKSGGK